jgi:hypothetical protein
MGFMSFAELTGAPDGAIPVGVPAPRPGGGCCIRDASGMHSLYGKGAAACQGLGGLGEPGWIRSGAPAESFWAGMKLLGGGASGRIRMQWVWEHRRPYGFWHGAAGAGWKRIAPGNMTPAMIPELLADIQAYEDRVQLAPGHRVTRPRPGQRSPRFRRAPSRPAPAAAAMSAYHRALARWRARAAQGHRDPLPQPPAPRKLEPRHSPATVTIRPSVPRQATSRPLSRPAASPLYASQARHGIPTSGRYVAPMPLPASSLLL